MHRSRLPSLVKHALSAKYPPPYTPFWQSSTFPVLRLPPTTSSYLYPLKVQFTRLWDSSGIIIPSYSIFHVPFPGAQDILSLPLSVRYWTIRQRYEEQGRKAEQIAAASPGGGGGLWWNVNCYVKSDKTVVRKHFARRMRTAFKSALEEAGFDKNGLRVATSRKSEAQVTKVVGRDGRHLPTGHLTGSLRINPTKQALYTPYEDLLQISRQVVGHLQEIRLEQQRGTVRNNSRRDDRRKEQTWQEAKISFFKAMESVQAEIERSGTRRHTQLADVGGLSENEPLRSGEDT
ncbi:MAG: hypothetical protein Q9165_004268 [Trypethelium subeluteriae]